MESLTCRLLPHAEADGPVQMAADQTMLESATAGMASLRFYTWSKATLSLGYFQPEAVRRGQPLLADIPFVRRPTGGDTLVHHHELTYALALPADRRWQPPAEPVIAWLTRAHSILAAVLARYQVPCVLAPAAGHRPFTGPLCFQHVTSGDLVIGTAKVVGSAQRRLRGALLQHGSILLKQNRHTPSLPGILELTGQALAVHEVRAQLESEWSRLTGWTLAPGEWSARERQRIDELVLTRYTHDAWNFKR